MESIIHNSEVVAEYDGAILAIPSIKIGNEYIYNGVLDYAIYGPINQRKRFVIRGYQNEIPIECRNDMLTFEKFRQISVVMDLTDVTAIFGCNGRSVPIGTGYSINTKSLHPVMEYVWRSDNKVSVYISFKGKAISMIFISDSEHSPSFSA